LDEKHCCRQSSNERIPSERKQSPRLNGRYRASVFSALDHALTVGVAHLKRREALQQIDVGIITGELGIFSVISPGPVCRS
jgi:hypothetical protein